MLKIIFMPKKKLKMNTTAEIEYKFLIAKTLGVIDFSHIVFLLDKIF